MVSWMELQRADRSIHGYNSSKAVVQAAMVDGEKPTSIGPAPFPPGKKNLQLNGTLVASPHV